MLHKLMLQQDWRYFLSVFISIFPCLFLILLQGIVSSRIAFKLGDPTPKLNGGFQFHPVQQIEPVGFLLFVTTGLGWGRWFPMESQNFKKPVFHTFLVFLGSTLTCLCFVLFSLLLTAICYHSGSNALFTQYSIWFFMDTSVLALSFALFQWVPLPYFHGFRCLYPFLPQLMKEKVQLYHSYCSLALVVCLWSGLFQTPILALMSWILAPCCDLLGIPFSMMAYYFL